MFLRSRSEAFGSLDNAVIGLQDSRHQVEVVRWRVVVLGHGELIATELSIRCSLSEHLIHRFSCESRVEKLAAFRPAHRLVALAVAQNAVFVLLELLLAA